MLPDEELMLKALALAERAYSEGEIPVGAVVVNADGDVIGGGYNRREALNSPTAHAEIAAIEEAARALNSRRLDNCTLYVTLEPCLMCAGAVMQARLRRLVYGAFSDNGAVSTVINAYDYPFGYKPLVRSGVLARECGGLVSRFTEELRLKGKSWTDIKGWFPTP